MASILSFDSRSMGALLNEKNQEFFSEEFPIFYKNKIPKMSNNGGYYYRTAIDRALRCNQVKAVDLMIDYIVKFQNSYVSSFLFNTNLPILLEKGITVCSLLSSNVFSLPFDFDDWPSSHTDNDTYQRGYNYSIFQLRYHYRTIFPDIPSLDENNDEENVDPSQIDSSKVYKITYSINILPQIGEYIRKDLDNGQTEFVNSDCNLMGLINETEELEIFESGTIQQLIEFKWDQYARKHHIFGCVMHLFYILMLIVYIDIVYINYSQDKEAQVMMWTVLLLFGILYPALYDWTQLARTGRAYFEDPWNYTDMLYIWSSIITLILQNTAGPTVLVSKILMITILFLALIKTFFFLRIFTALSPIVTMLTNVIYDLRIFLFFYSILIVLFSLQLGILGIGNPNIEGNFKKSFGADAERDDEGEFVAGDKPGAEYDYLGLFLGNLITTLRMSMGDFGFDSANLLDGPENGIYWAVWLLIVVITNIIFLNFIIAEASASYEKVSENLEAFILKERAALI